MDPTMVYYNEQMDKPNSTTCSTSTPWPNHHDLTYSTSNPWSNQPSQLNCTTSDPWSNHPNEMDPAYLFYPTIDYPLGITNTDNNDQMNFFHPNDPMYSGYPAGMDPSLFQTNPTPQLTRTNSSDSQFTSDQLNSTPNLPEISLPYSNLYQQNPISYPYHLPTTSTTTSNTPYWPSQPHTTTTSHSHPTQLPSPHGNKRIYSFVTMSTPTKSKKRLRRKFDEIERSFRCRHPHCTKSYGTLNNLNAHIIMQSHGTKRLASEFKSNLRK